MNGTQATQLDVCKDRQVDKSVTKHQTESQEQIQATQIDVCNDRRVDALDAITEVQRLVQRRMATGVGEGRELGQDVFFFFRGEPSPRSTVRFFCAGVIPVTPGLLSPGAGQL